MKTFSIVMIVNHRICTWFWFDLVWNWTVCTDVHWIDFVLYNFLINFFRQQDINKGIEYSINKLQVGCTRFCFFKIFHLTFWRQFVMAFWTLMETGSRCQRVFQTVLKKTWFKINLEKNFGGSSIFFSLLTCHIGYHNHVTQKTIKN